MLFVSVTLSTLSDEFSGILRNNESYDESEKYWLGMSPSKSRKRFEQDPFSSFFNDGLIRSLKYKVVPFIAIASASHAQHSSKHFHFHQLHKVEITSSCNSQSKPFSSLAPFSVQPRLPFRLLASKCVRSTIPGRPGN